MLRRRISSPASPSRRLARFSTSWKACSASLVRGQIRRGRDTITLVGFELLLGTSSLGISERRAEWCVQCWKVLRIQPSKRVSARSGVWSVRWSTRGAFWGPVINSCHGTRVDPCTNCLQFVSMILRYLEEPIERSRHFDGAQELQPEQQARRVDAQASDGWTGVG